MKLPVVIFGGGRVGTAMSLEMPGVPVCPRSEDYACEVACICWPAQAIRDFAATHPYAAAARKVAFCNGSWAVSDGADSQGICYVRAVQLGDRAVLGRKSWRVGEPEVADVLARAGLGVVCSRSDHVGHVVGKMLYILPLALACNLQDCDAKTAAKTEDYAAWYYEVRNYAVHTVGEGLVMKQEARVRFLVDRSPRGWRPSSSKEELDYFVNKLYGGD